MVVAEKFLCECGKQVTKTKNDRYRTHTDGEGNPCPLSSVEIPEHVLSNPVGDAGVPQDGLDYGGCLCGRRVKLTRLGYFEDHNKSLRGDDRCENGGTRYRSTTSTAPGSTSAGAVSSPTALPPSPGVTAPETPTPAGANLARDPMPAGDEVLYTEDSTHTVKPSAPSTGSSAPAPTPSSPASTTTSSPSQPVQPDPVTSSDAPEGPADVGPWHLAPLLDDRILQPFSHLLQPFPVPVTVRAKEAMGDRDKEIVARLRAMFYAHTNNSARTQQKTIGPSEIGSECDRRLGAKLLGLRPVNPGGDGWAAWVGTQIHAGLATMFDEADAGQGRYVTEMPLTFGSVDVPRGTSDLLDRTLLMILDSKCMGKYSLKKLINFGPSPQYRVQVHTYGYGAEQAGEKVRYVAIIAWPRESSSLDDLYVWSEPYDRKIAQAAIKRVEKISGRVKAGEFAQLPVADDCRYCPMYLKGVKGLREDGACGGSS